MPNEFSLAPVNLVVRIGFLVATIAFAIWKSRGKKEGADFFLGGRGLTWPIIGLSIVAANISSEPMRFAMVTGLNSESAPDMEVNRPWGERVSYFLMARR